MSKSDKLKLSRDLRRAISQHLPAGRTILADEIHESVLDVVLPALRDQMPPAREYLFAMMACNPAERERALDAYAHELAEEIRRDTLAHGRGPVHPNEPAHHWRQGRQEAADLIDPGVE